MEDQLPNYRYGNTVLKVGFALTILLTGIAPFARLVPPNLKNLIGYGSIFLAVLIMIICSFLLRNEDWAEGHAIQVSVSGILIGLGLGMTILFLTVGKSNLSPVGLVGLVGGGLITKQWITRLARSQDPSYRPYPELQFPHERLGFDTQEALLAHLEALEEEEKEELLDSIRSQISFDLEFMTTQIEHHQKQMNRKLLAGLIMIVFYITVIALTMMRR